MAVSADGTQHVPAWKKLGLKLKNAADTPTESDSTSNSQQNGAHAATSQVVVKSEEQLSASKGKKSKRSRDDSGESHETKKQRLSNADDVPLNVSSPAVSKQISEHAVNTPAKIRLNDVDKIQSSLRRSPSKGIDRRKSVTFSNDTKIEDGDSAHTLFKAWAAGNNSGGPANEFDMSAEEIEFYSSLERKAAEAAAEEAEKAAKKTEAEAKSQEAKPSSSKSKEPKRKESKSKESKESKKSKKDKSDTAIPTPEKKTKIRTPKSADKPTPSYLNYLIQYYNDKSNWKFNKAKQTDLLKNIYNIYRVGPEYNEALSEYINGLQGAAARSRLRSSAKQIVTDSISYLQSEEDAKPSEMESAAARQAAYDAALARELELLKSKGVSTDDTTKTEKLQILQQKQMEDERAARMLINLIEEDLGEDLNGIATGSAASGETKAKENETARSRKKKRKMRTEVSDSDSDSDSSDSEKEGKPALKKLKTAAKKEQTASDSSSDESDSESSSSDGSSDSSSSEESEDDSSSDSSGSGSDSD